MALQLNEQRKGYQEFYGRNIDKMPELINEGFSPMTFAQVMQRRLDVLGKNQELVDAWWNNYFDTVDGIAYHPDGRVKMVLDSQTARELNPKSKIQNSALVLPDGAYEQFEGEEFSKEDVAKYAAQESLTLKAALSNPFWAALARDPKLHEEYVQAVFKEAKARYGYDKNMGVYTSEFKEVPNMRLWLLGRLGSGGSSGANGYDYLSYSSGLLVGVAPEAQGAAKIAVPTLEQIMTISSKYLAPANMEAVRKELGKLYER